ncbi:unnamed protein product [Caenorhabditis bovis]|uniref:C2H2-type domain-containing protein n=1 Tax=Caenorhabditis bovis TaxID=2654633 RepID=A0A8S1ESK5_9PELO|nr:unnamed protein product [Caenorhabditis bovis]
MTIEARQRKRPTNGRVSPSEVKHFMCYLCGDIFNQSIDYQRHLIAYHQLMSLCYQIWHAKNGRSTSRRNVIRNEPRNAIDEVIDAVASDGKKKRRASSLDEPTVEELEKLRDVEIPLDQKNKESKSEKKEPKHKKKKESTDGDDDIIKPERTMSDFSKNSNRICNICDSHFNDFYHYVKHYIDVHHYMIDSIYMLLFNKNGTQFNRKISPPGKSCGSCYIKFDRNQSYFEHLLEQHTEDVINVLYKKYNSTHSVDVEVTLKNKTGQDLVKNYNILIKDVLSEMGLD